MKKIVKRGIDFAKRANRRKDKAADEKRAKADQNIIKQGVKPKVQTKDKPKLNLRKKADREVKAKEDKLYKKFLEKQKTKDIDKVDFGRFGRGKLGAKTEKQLQNLKETRQELKNLMKNKKGNAEKIELLKNKIKDMKNRLGSVAKDFNRGGDLKPVPSGDKGKGLSMLPTSVRNNMGFMKKGGMLKKPFGNIDFRMNKGGLLIAMFNRVKKKKT